MSTNYYGYDPYASPGVVPQKKKKTTPVADVVGYDPYGRTDATARGTAVATGDDPLSIVRQTKVDPSDPREIPAPIPSTSGHDGGTGGSSGGGGGSGGGVGGMATSPGLNGDYTTPTGGLVGYYGGKMNSSGMTADEYNALVGSTMAPIQQQQQQAGEAMLRARAATGNDAGLYGGLAQTAKNAGAQSSSAMRSNVLTNEQIRRQEQAEGAAGNLNLYGQTQAETMEYLRMLGNLLGRTRSGSQVSAGSGTGVSAGVSYTPGM